MAASTWGDPFATKRVLLIHGVTGSSQIWSRVAQDLASRGYFVTAPDLLGHGQARRGSVYTVAALAEELRPLLLAARDHDRPYDIIAGHSLGGLVAAALLPLLESSRPVRVILVDPPLEVSTETAYYRAFFVETVQNPTTPEACLEEHPNWAKVDAEFAILGQRLCDAAAVEAIFDQNVPWSFSHHLKAVPDNIEVFVLVADPSREPILKEEDVGRYPRVTPKTVWGASHWIPFDAPQSIVETALEGTEVRK